MPRFQSARTVRNRLRTANARWEAAPNGLSSLSDQAKIAMLGVVVDQAALAAAMAPVALATAEVPQFDQEVDWRNRNGNHVSAIENQRNCGSCVSFCAAAQVSSMASIEHGQLLNLSEADLHFNSDHGATCGGWWPDSALNWARDHGIAYEADFQYLDAFDNPPQSDPNPPNLWIPHARQIADHDRWAVRITNWATLRTDTARKNHLSNVGPCSAVIHVFDDFYPYSTGVYHQVTGQDRGMLHQYGLL